MQQQGKQLTQRFALILFVLIVGIWGIFPNMYKLDFHPDLRPGIDISGGTSLVYEIKPPPGPVESDLAQRVADSLKKRVDPDGVKNLVWRPLGATQLEIQMPISAGSEQAGELRKAFSNAQVALERTNVRLAEVRAAMALPDAVDRTKRLDELAMGSAERHKLFAELEAANKTLAAAEKATDALKRVEARDAVSKIESLIEATNLPVGRLQTDLELFEESIAKAQRKGNQANIKAEQANRDARIKQIKAQYDFPARAAAVDNYVQSFDAFAKVKGHVSDSEDLKRLLRGSGVLEFHILVTDPQQIATMAERLKQDGPATKPGDTMEWFEVDRPENFQRPTQSYGGKQWALAYITPDESMTHDKGKPWGLQKAYRDFDSRSNQSVVGFKFDPQGSVRFGDLSGAHVGKPLAIVLDGRIISAPNLLTRIEGSGQITGNFSDQEIKYLVSTLNAGSLPARLDDEPIRERTVGPTLGRDNLRSGLRSCLIGVLAVVIFMIIYYHFSGLVASIAVIMNLVLIVGIMAMFQATFTLPGIAALVLTVGMAVDANVLIFERLREEQHRGLSLRLALHNAYDRAFSAILDSNVTTVATSLVLYFFGSEEVKGFGLTLSIGITSSMFTALFVTRAIFDLCIEEFGMTRLGSLPLSWPKLDQMLRPKVDWMSKIWYFYAFSIILIVGGVTCFFAKGRDMWDIEFVSGTSVEIELTKATPIQEVRDRLDAPPLDKILHATVVAVGDKSTDYEVVTPNPDSRQVRAILVDKLSDLLKVEPPATFAGSGKPLEDVLDNEVVPITAKPLEVNGFVPVTRGATGGVAIVLRNITPKLTPNNLQERLDRARLDASLPFMEIKVTSPEAAGVPTGTAVVIASDPNVDYEKDPAQWKTALAGEVWKLTNEAVGRPAELRRVTRFDPQVADVMKVDASIAVGISIVVIAVYIWIRFANVRFGTATVVALIHDVLITIGVIGLSQYLSFGIFRSWLLIEPLRMNLTLVAAVLTVMGYSVNDTIIVFDRIRENRGKYGYVSEQIINDSVNQTLSRTLLTSGTTLATIFVMYVFGGAGIHGFTFALLAGILVGTYSSIAIAAPILLWGGKDVRHDGKPSGTDAKRELVAARK